MKKVILTCDVCNRSDENGLKIVPYQIYTKKGEFGFLIDYDKLDMCYDCWKQYVEKNKKTKNVFPVASWW